MIKISTALKYTLLSTLLGSALYATTTITNLSPVTNYASSGSVATVLAPTLTMTSTSTFSSAIVDVTIANITSGDQLALLTVASASIVLGEVSIVGSDVFLGDGTVANLVGSINPSFTGNGTALQINFVSVTQFTNGNFSTGANGDIAVTGWTLTNQQAILGSTTIAGQASPLDSTYPVNAVDDSDVPSSASFNSQLQSAETPYGTGLALEMRSYMDTLNGFDVVRGPYIESNAAITLQAGDTISFDWRALNGGDAYDVFGYIVEVNTGATQIILDETGADDTSVSPWVTVGQTIATAGDYKFVFLSGTYDFTGGRVAGAQLYIDNVIISVNTGPSVVTTTMIEGILRNITYFNTDTPAPIGDRNLSISVLDNDGLTGRIDTVLTRANVAPTSTDSSYQMDENTSKIFSGSDFNFTDTDNDSFVQIRIDSLPAKGTLELSGVSVNVGDSILVSNLANLIYTPVIAESSKPYANFSFSVYDGGAYSITHTATINVGNDTVVVSCLKNLYLNVLSRTADAGGLAFWEASVNNGEVSGAEVMTAFFSSSEFTNRNLNDLDYITTLYQVILQRSPDAGGQTAWLNALESGFPRADMLKAFLGTAEFAAVCASYNIPAMIKNKILTFVEHLYVELLGRASDPAGLAYWSGELAAQTLTGSDVVRGFTSSSELIGSALSDQEYVNKLYTALLGRPADAGGLDAWTNAISSGAVTRNQALEGFLASQEFKNLAASFYVLP